MSTLAEYVASQEELVKEAGLALPHQFSQCTYALGHIRQAVYLCLTCPEVRGICPACSIACHTNHNQIELFPKRNFRCDCPTDALAHPCTLHTDPESANALNQYGQNFQAKFCRCGRSYDAKTEPETMIQCLSCEDWFHESCCKLRTRPPSRPPTPEPTEVAPDDASSSSSGLPPALISADDYDAFVCRACVLRIPTLRRYAGTPGAITVVRADASSAWTRLGDEDARLDTEVGVVDATVVGAKRPPSPSQSGDEPPPKRARTTSSSHSTPPCLAPPPHPLVQSAYITPQLDCETALCTGDVFLTQNFRARWCRCDSCLPSLEAHPYLLEEEDTYEPPEDPDSALSLETLGLRALARLPREQAIDGIHAFNLMRDNLRAYLRPFAEEGKVVDEADVQTFFEGLNKARVGGAEVDSRR